MRLIVHAGLHKTGSTYLQHVMNDNHASLLDAGVYYEPQSGYPAHHFAAWDLLRGDASRLAAMLAAGRQAGAHTAVFSSEDLEGLIFDPSAVQLIEQVAAASGVDDIEWHMCLRDPGQYFASLYSQLQHHVYADAVAMLCDVLRDGMIMILDPLGGGEGTPFWCYCFDHARHLTAFAKQTAHPLFLHDFRDAAPFPGWGVLDAAGGLGAIEALPGATARNERMSREAVCDGYAERVARLLSTDAKREALLPHVCAQVARNLDAMEPLSHAVSERFAASMEAALDAFSYRRSAAPLTRAA